MSTQVISIGSALASATLGDTASVEEIEEYIGKLIEAEIAIHRWATDLAALIDQRVATCLQIAQYHSAALQVYEAERRLVIQMLRAGVSGIPPIYFPTIFGDADFIRNAKSPTFAINLAAPGCIGGIGRPNYDRVKQAVPPLPKGVQPPIPLGAEVTGQLGIAFVVWGAIALGVLIGGTVAVIIDRNFVGTEAVQIEKLNLKVKALRVSKTRQCFFDQVALQKAQGNAVSSEMAQKIHDTCRSQVDRQTPLSTVPKQFSITRFVTVWGTVGLAGYAGYKIGKKRGWF